MHGRMRRDTGKGVVELLARESKLSTAAATAAAAAPSAAAAAADAPMDDDDDDQAMETS